MQSVGRVECLVFSRRPEWTVLPDDDPAYPGEGDPVFVPGRLPEQGEGCYLYERVRDRDGELIGALGHDACGV